MRKRVWMRFIAAICVMCGMCADGSDSFAQEAVVQSQAQDTIEESVPDHENTALSGQSEAVPETAVPDSIGDADVSMQSEQTVQACEPDVMADEQVWSYAEGGLCALGFEVLGHDIPLEVHAGQDVSSLIQAVARDDELLQMMSLYRAFEAKRGVALDAVIDDALESFFDSRNDTIPAQHKSIILATLLPMLISHAKDSGAFITAKKLNAIYDSLHLHISNTRYDIACTMADADYAVSMLFPVETLQESGFVSAAGFTKCPSAAAESEQSDAQDGLFCNVFERSVPDAQASQNDVLFQTLWGLLEKDNDVIVTGMGRLIDYLVKLDESRDLSAVWADRWQDADIENMMCQVMTLELLALEQHRFVELSRLERQITRLFKGATFYKRLSLYPGCRMNADFGTVSRRLMTDHRSEIDWMIKHFAPKSRKKVDKPFREWTRKIAKTSIIFRRLLAALTMWSEGAYGKAILFAGDVAEKRSIVAHPQLYSLYLLLHVAGGDGLELNTLDYFTRVMLLKVPALMYQTLVEMVQFLDKESRLAVVQAVRKYAPSLVPHEIARFYIAYEPEFRKSMDAAHRIQFDAWLDRIASDSGSMQTRKTSILRWYNDLIEAKDWNAIIRLSQKIVSDASLDDAWHCAFAMAGTYARQLTDGSGPDLENVDDVCAVDSDVRACIGKQGSSNPRDGIKAVSKCVP